MNLVSPFVIRDARPDEIDIVRELTLAAYAEYAEVMRPAAWEGLRQAVDAGLATLDVAQCIVAEERGALLGSVLLYPPEADAYGDAADRTGWPVLRLLAVAPAARARGVGTALLAECAHRAERAGASALGLHTSESMRVAIRMYERMGFVRAPEYDFQPAGAELVMAYLLPLGCEAPSSHIS